jgi:AcrR family transcriptional regulator
MAGTSGDIRLSSQTRGRPPVFSQQQFVDAAIDAIEQKGFEAVTMRDVARCLGATSSAAYRHVSDKDALLFLAADQIIGFIRIPRTGDALTRLVRLLVNIRDVLHRYPGVAAYIVQVGPPTPTAVAVSKAVQELLAELGCPEASVRIVFSNLYNLIIGDAFRRTRDKETDRHAVRSFTDGVAALLRGFGLEVSLGGPDLRQRA